MESILSFHQNCINVDSHTPQRKLIFKKITNNSSGMNNLNTNNYIKKNSYKPKIPIKINNTDTNKLIQEILNQKNKQKLKMTLLSKKRLPSKREISHKKNNNHGNLLPRNTPEQIEEIRNKYYHSTFRFYDKKYKINTTYKYQAESKNFLYFTCSRRPYCHGGCKINKIYSKIEITNRCDPDIQHDILSYDEFLLLYEQKEFDKIDWSIKKHQNMYVAITFKKKLVTENPYLVELFKKDTGKDLKLRSHEISVIKARIADTCNDLSIEQIIEKIKPEFNVIINSFHVDYKIDLYDNKTKNIIKKNKKGKIVVFGIKDMFDNLNNYSVGEYLVDTSFRIIQKKFLNYKMVIVTGINYNKNEAKICCFAFMENDDYMSYCKLFQFLNKIYNFNPKIINTDYEQELCKSLNYWYDLFSYKPKHKYNFFSYEKFLRERLKTISNKKKEFTLSCLEALINLELVSFIDKNKVIEAKKVLSEIMKRNYDCNKIFNYIDKNWFNQYLNEINFSNLNLVDYKSQNNKELSELYKIYHISELYHKNLDSYIPKYAISMNTFISQFKKLFKNYNYNVSFDLNNINQKYEYHLQTLIYIINKNNINIKPKWIEIKTYVDSIKQIIIENNENNKYSEQDILNIIKDINYWNVINTCKKDIEQLLGDNSDDILGTRQILEIEKRDNEFGIECISNIEKYERNDLDEKNNNEWMANEQTEEILGEIGKILDMNEKNKDKNLNNSRINEINNNKENENFDNNENSEDIVTTKDIYNKYDE